jgi:hypothetical protein
MHSSLLREELISRRNWLGVLYLANNRPKCFDSGSQAKTRISGTKHDMQSRAAHFLEPDFWTAGRV